MNNYFSSNLKHLRNQSGMTQLELANKLGKDYSTIGKWELGQRNPIMEDMLKLSDIFNINIQDLAEKDLRFQNDNKLGELEILFNKAKDKLDPSQEATIKFVMQDAIKKYEEEKNKGSDI